MTLLDLITTTSFRSCNRSFCFPAAASDRLLPLNTSPGLGRPTSWSALSVWFKISSKGVNGVEIDHDLDIELVDAVGTGEICCVNERLRVGLRLAPIPSGC